MGVLECIEDVRRLTRGCQYTYFLYCAPPLNVFDSKQSLKSGKFQTIELVSSIVSLAQLVSPSVALPAKPFYRFALSEKILERSRINLQWESEQNKNRETMPDVE